MELVTEMAPDGYRPGLAAWYCPHCGAADSDLIHNLKPAEFNTGSSRLGSRH
jgi:hypothetical protein